LYPLKVNVIYSAEKVTHFLLEKWLLNRKIKIYMDISFNQFKHLSKFMLQYLVYAKLYSFFFPESYLLAAQHYIYWKGFASCATVRLKWCAGPPPRAAPCPASGHGLQCTRASCLADPCHEE